MADDFDFTENYAKGETPWDTGRPSQQLLRMLDAARLPGTTVLEFGCGTGLNAIEFARRGYKVTAVDNVPQAVETARGRAEAAKASVDFLVADALKDDLGGPYDVLFDRGVYHVLRMVDLKAFQAVLKRVTRPGTLWLSLAGNANEKKSEKGPPVVEEGEIRSELEPLFEILELSEFRFDSSQSGFHPLAWSILSRRR